MNPSVHIAKLEQSIAEHLDECECLRARLEDMGMESQQIEQIRQQWVTTLE